MLFGLCRREALAMLVGLLGFFQRSLLLDFLRAGDQIVDLGHAKPLLNDRSVHLVSRKVRAAAAARTLIQIKR
jgi:hypothetical protein